MSNQTFISVGPYWDVIHRHRTSFFSTIAAGLVLTMLALVLVPKEYTSSVLLEVWHSDVQPTFDWGRTSKYLLRLPILKRVWRRSARRPLHAAILRN